MDTIKNIQAYLDNGVYDEFFKKLYACPAKNVDCYRKRFVDSVNEFYKLFGDRNQIELFSAPGRAEICGNHTDHQLGHVLAASVDLDIIAVASTNNTDIIRIKSDGFPLDAISINELTPCEREKNTAAALIRGMVSKFKDMGYRIGGFDAYTTSDVAEGSGLSSSAAFEVIIGNIIKELFYNPRVTDIEIAKAGQYAENVYYGKPCGLMDQLACSIGGIISVDFSNPSVTSIDKIDYELAYSGFSMCIIDSGGSHKEFGAEYTAIRNEMMSVAEFFNCKVLSQVSKKDFFSKIPQLRLKLGDRAVLRAMHFFEEEKRVEILSEALKKNDKPLILKTINESGQSSAMYLQNLYSPKNIKQQSVPIALAMCDKILKGRGAYKVHGGGFAGTVQAFVPNDLVKVFKQEIEKVLGKGTCRTVNIRSVGGTKIQSINTNL